jgi:hypothetical protein
VDTFLSARRISRPVLRDNRAVVKEAVNYLLLMERLDGPFLRMQPWESGDRSMSS